MAKNERKERDLKVFQSNKMTLATYNFTANQKNIIYRILVAIKTDLVQENLLGDKIIYIEKTLLLKYRQDVKRLKADLRVIKSCIIEFSKDNGDYVIAGIVNDSTIKARVPQVEIVVNKKFIEFVRHLYKEFTAYDLTVVLSLKGPHAKRFYEICCMVKNLGKYRFSLLELKKMLGVENKYRDVFDFKNRIMVPAKKRINECETAEVSFDYTFERENREVFVVLKIKDKKKGILKDAQKQKKEDDLHNKCRMYLSNLGITKKLDKIYLYLVERDFIYSFVMKYEAKFKKYSKEGKTQTDLVRTMVHVLKADFEVDFGKFEDKEAGNVVKEKGTSPKAERKKLLEIYNKNKGNTKFN